MDGCKPAPVPVLGVRAPRHGVCQGTEPTALAAGEEVLAAPAARPWEPRAGTGWAHSGLCPPHTPPPQQDIQSGATDSSHGSHKMLLLSFLWNKWYCFQKVIKTYARRECRELGY